LRSATSGVGAFETKFDHLAELSGRTADQVISARQRATA
jgi:elongation factor G